MEWKNNGCLCSIYVFVIASRSNGYKTIDEFMIYNNYMTILNYLFACALYRDQYHSTLRVYRECQKIAL